MSNQELEFGNLPEILKFRESEAPVLVETHRRIIETANQDGPEKAAAVVSTYEHLAEEHLRSVHLTAQPSALSNRHYSLAWGGMLIHLAGIWHEAGIKNAAIRQRFLAALDRAIDYSRRMNWRSIATLLEDEKQKQQSANG